MVIHDDFELRITTVSNDALADPVVQPFPKPARYPPPTVAKTLEVMRATKGAAAAIGSVRGLGDASYWNEAAFWSPCTTRGAASTLPVLWGCDFPGSDLPLATAAEYCLAFFAGFENLGFERKPHSLDGEIWCYMKTPEPGTYVFVAHVQTYSDDGFSPGYFATAYFGINTQLLGFRAIRTGVPTYLPFVVNLPAGTNRFVIYQHTGALFFVSVTAYRISAPTS